VALDSRMRSHCLVWLLGMALGYGLHVALDGISIALDEGRKHIDDTQEH
jgi:hypothetical protein